MEHSRETELSTEIYYHVKPLKFVLMSIATLGLYEVYWHYRCWKFIKRRDESKIWPIARALFCHLWYYALLVDIGKRGGRNRLGGRLFKASLALAFLLLGLSWRLPQPWWMLGFLTVLPLLPAVGAIDKLNIAADGPPARHAVHRPVNYLAYLVGGPFAAYLLLASIHFFPSTQVTPGVSLWDRDIAFLRQTGILAPDEEIIYFYSLGMLSVKSDGQFISEDYVTSYWADPVTDEIYMAYAAYEEIADIQVQWGEGLEPTVVTVWQIDGGRFDLWLSTEGGGDRMFVEEMSRQWNQRQSLAVAI